MKTKKRQSRSIKLIRSLHRDIGYFCIGMTIVFSVSGIAVNHIDDWNPNYQVERRTESINIDDHTQESDSLDQQILQQLAIDRAVKTNFWESPTRYKLFVENETTIVVNFKKQTALVESVTKRPIISAFNRLHLNEVNRAWVYFSDLFAVLLLFLATSALFMLKGKNSVWGIKGLWVIAGIFIPAVFLLI